MSEKEDLNEERANLVAEFGEPERKNKSSVFTGDRPDHRQWKGIESIDFLLGEDKWIEPKEAEDFHKGDLVIIALKGKLVFNNSDRIVLEDGTIITLGSNSLTQFKLMI